MIIRHFKAVRLLVSAITVFAAFGALPGIAAANTVIDLTYDSVMDMVRPEVHPGIAVHHNLQVTVSGGGNLSEGRNRGAGPHQDRNAMMQVLSSSGDDAAYASWRVAPDGRLVRIQNDPQSTRTMTVTLLPVVELTVQVKEVDPDAPVVSVAVTVTVDVPAVVGVPEIRPDEELMDSPAGSPVAL